jgi:hypothetical protein
MFAFTCRRSKALAVAAAVTSLTISFMVGVSPASASPHPRTTVDGYSLGPSNTSRVAVATSEADKLLGLAWFPPGSRTSASWIYVNGHQYTEGVPTIGSPDVVDIAHYYVAGGKYQGLSWLDGHVPKGSRLDGRGGTDRAHLEWSYSFPTTSFISFADLQYTKLILPNGKVELRIDAQIQWTPQKSAYSLIGVGANKLTAIVTTGALQRPTSTKSIVTKNAATIASIRDDVNALPVAYPGVMHCPVESGGSMVLKFYRAHGTDPFAVASAGAGGCGDVFVRQYAADGKLIGSGDDGGGGGLIAEVEKLLGLTQSQQ